MSVKDILLTRSKHYQRLEKQYANRLEFLGNLRLFSFLAGAGCSLFAFFIGMKALAVLVLVPALSVFLAFVWKHTKVKRELNMTRCMVEIQSRYLKRISGEWVQFEDCGLEFVDSSHPYTYDLDIFGPKSLFQWISVAKTAAGRSQLKTLLEYPPKDLNSMKRRQNAARELGTNLDFCQKLECYGMLAGEAALDTEQIAGFVNQPLLFFKGIETIRWLPVITILTFALFFLGWDFPYQIPIALLSIQTVMFGFGCWKLTPELSKVYSFQKSLGPFRNMFSLIECEKFEDEYLSELRSEMCGEYGSASDCMKQLERISEAIDLHYQSILYFIFGVLFLWDFHCAVYLDRWKVKNGQRVGRWFEAIGTIEALSSLSVILHIHPDWVFPEIHDQEQEVMARDLGHPLIQSEKCIRNDIEINKRSCIVTGSNMSGKSTFLRTIGVNLVLAYSGTAVSARQFRCSIMDVFTSMVIRDDLINGISTFYAELTRINLILKRSRQQKPMIYLIDEVFRGTNSLDRITGARVVLRELNRNGALGLISTHDFELCDLENDWRVKFKNYHFEEQYSNGEIKFDYKLRSGRCSTSNARFLMNMVGIDLPE